ncbi:unnamed protein product [Symbiodinium natans]|uniref:Right handed beta helix domain-containing protein n=1 Tax=Symbiodinium natans TaxID=878477 RepID=A0A812MJB6_9DINO|nr:unnamed protein product [Symbiodinium natans]
MSEMVAMQGPCKKLTWKPGAGGVAEGLRRCALCCLSWPEQLCCPWPAEEQEQFAPPSQLPALCLPCDQLVRRRPSAQETGLSVLARGGAAALGAAAAHLSDGEQEFQSVLSQKVFDLGEGRSALLLSLASRAAVARALRLGVPGCAVDYLPDAEEQASSYTVTVAPAVLDLRHSAPAQQSADALGAWLAGAGCAVLRCHGHCVELGDAESRLRALALNGAGWQGHVMKVRDAQPPGPMAPAPLRRLQLHWLRALRGLCPAPKRLICAFLGEAPVMVPHDATSIQEALAMSPAEVIITSGTYRLAEGLRLRSRVRLRGQGGATLELCAPIEVQSEFGAELANLEMVGCCSSGCAADSGDRCPNCPRSLVRILGSHLVALGRGLVGSLGAFGCCSWGKAEVVLDRCTLRGGHHALDIRGGCGVRSRAGKQVAGLQESEECPPVPLGFDLGAWLARCRAHGAHGVPKVEPQGFRPWSPEIWQVLVQTHVRMIDCDVSDAGMEAINLWRGARLHLQHCRLQNCGQGISASLYESRARLADFEPFQEPYDLVIEGCQFADFGRHDWSSAVSLGRFATTGFYRESALTKKCVAGGDLRLRACFVGNTVRNCHAGLLASECALEAKGNRFESIQFGAFQLFNGSAVLEENELVNCAVAVSIRAGPRDRTPGASTCQLRANTLRSCDVGLKACSVQGSLLQCDSQAERFLDNGDGLLVQGSGAQLRLSRCHIARCQRGGASVAKEGRLELDSCDLLDNGRGVVVAGGSSANVQRCCFQGNTGWAIRLEPTPSVGAGDPEVTSITENVFGTHLRGNAGRKRIRVDARDQAAVVAGNTQADGEAVDAVMPGKMPRRGDLEAVVAEFGSLSMA